MYGNRYPGGFRPEALLGGRFIMDFCASSIDLVVEVDGGYHARRRAADASSVALSRAAL